MLPTYNLRNQQRRWLMSRKSCVWIQFLPVSCPPPAPPRPAPLVPVNITSPETETTLAPAAPEVKQEQTSVGAKQSNTEGGPAKRPQVERWLRGLQLCDWYSMQARFHCTSSSTSS